MPWIKELGKPIPEEIKVQAIDMYNAYALKQTGVELPVINISELHIIKAITTI